MSLLPAIRIHLLLRWGLDHWIHCASGSASGRHSDPTIAERLLVDPHLISISDKNPASVLTAILAPSGSIDTRYSTYVAELKDRRIILGILVGETATNITLHVQTNQKHNLLCSDIQSLTSTGRSLMPDGLEAALSSGTRRHHHLRSRRLSN